MKICAHIHSSLKKYQDQLIPACVLHSKKAAETNSRTKFLHRGILRQVIEFCYKNALILTTHQINIDERKYICALDTLIWTFVL